MEPPLITGEERPYPLLQYNDSLRKLIELPKLCIRAMRDVENIQVLIKQRTSRQQPCHASKGNHRIKAVHWI